MSNVIATAVSKTLNVVLAKGSATFTNSTNNIALTGIGVGVEVGDVIQISGAANAKNNSEFTVEVITDDNNVIVNQAHAGGTTTKALVSETATVTVKLLCKWYLAPIGLGQGWVNVTASRLANTPYQSNTKRSIIVFVQINNSSVSVSLSIDSVTASQIRLGGGGDPAVRSEVPSASEYLFSGGTPTLWVELR